MTENNPTNMPEQKEDEIDLIAIAKTLWESRKTIIWFSIAGLVIGLFVAFLSPRQYTVTSVIVPQYTSKTTGSGLSALASMAGINIGGAETGGEISPLLYPQIVQSVPFQLELMNTPVHFQEVDHPVSVFEYYTEFARPSLISIIKKYTIGLPGIILTAIRPEKDSILIPSDGKGPKVIALSEKQDIIYQFLSKSVLLDANAKEGYLTFTTTMAEPLVAAEVGQLAQNLLQQFVIDFKTQKSKNELEFIQERYDAAKTEMERKQYNAAASTDKNKFLTTTTAQLGTTRANTNYQISNAVFMELAKQLEQAKIQVKKDTPTFTVVQPITIPNEPSGTGKLLKLIMGFLIGLFFGFFVVYLKNKLSLIKDRLSIK